MAKKMKKLLSMVLALSMVLSLLSVVASAETGYECGLKAGDLVCTLEVHSHSVENNCYPVSCSNTDTEHVHSEAEECYGKDPVCGKTPHEHVGTCYHSHTVSCLSSDAQTRVNKVIAELESIDSLQGMQDARANFTVSSNYNANNPDSVAEHDAAKSGYNAYIADMTAKRAAAKASYQALSAIEQTMIPADLAAKLSEELSTWWVVDHNPTMTRTINPATAEGYNYQLIQTWKRQYENSPHATAADNTACLFILVDSSEKEGTWTWMADGRYKAGQSNYELAYCSDVSVTTVDGTHYKRVNLEDNGYYGKDAAEHIRAIVVNSYPFVTVDEMKANLIAGGLDRDMVNAMDRGEMIAAVQMAIWSFANAGTEEVEGNTAYGLTYRLRQDRCFHDYTNEHDYWWNSAAGYGTYYPEIETRINTVVQYLKGLRGLSLTDKQIVITGVDILSAEPAQASDKEGVYNVAMKVQLNGGGSSDKDDITITATSYTENEDGTRNITGTSSTKVDGNTIYDMAVEAKYGEYIEVVVSGTQHLPQGAYFYQPEPSDRNQDGIYTSKETSQNLVGVAMGDTAVSAKVVITDTKIPEEKPETASISLKKTDIEGAILTGAEFALSVVTGNDVITAGTYAVDVNGELTIENLLSGKTYEITEVTAPNGYQKMPGAVRFSVTDGVVEILSSPELADYENGVLTVENKLLTKVTVKKVDEAGKELTGAEFTLYHNGVKIGTYAVNENGEVTIAGLLPGATYELKETKAPAGYVRPAKSISFKVDEQNKVILIDGKNAVVEKSTTTVITGEKEGVIVVGEELPVISLELKPGTNPQNEITGKINTETGYDLIKRTASGVVSEVKTTVNSSATGETKSVAPVYDKFNGVKEDKGGMFDYQFNEGLTSKYSNPASWTNMPADADVRYVGTGEHSKYYVYCAYVEYDKNADGSTKVDANGNYVIKELRRYDAPTDPVLTINGEKTNKLYTSLGFESVYDNPGGSRPFIFAMKDRLGQAYYGYCCDLDTPTSDGYYYSIANLEDSNYYASEASEKHIRSIVMNGYWGSTDIPDANGKYAFGSLELLKQKLIDYIDANPELNTELTAPVLDRNNKYQPLKDENGNTVYATKTMREMVEGLTSGEALLATQAAIWSYANGTTDVLNGKNGSIVLDPDGYKWNHDPVTGSKTAGGYTNGEAMDDFASTAVDFLYTWLINLDTEETSTTVINDMNFIENLTLDIGNKIEDNEENDVYSVDLSFDLGFIPGEKDNLLVELTYGDSTITRRLAGENGEGEAYAAITVKDGRYVIEGVGVPENEISEMTIRLVGKQYLEHGAYIYHAYGGREKSQNFIGATEGEKIVDVSKSISFSYQADETKTIVEAHEEEAEVLKVTNVLIPHDPRDPYDPPATPSYTAVTVSKVWDDNDNAAGIRPESIEAQLYADGVAYGAPVVLNEGNGWSYTWTNLPKGVYYTVDEVSVPEGYVKTVSGYTITNTLPEEEFPEEDPPLADVPGNNPSEEEIFEEDVPLAGVPATGDMTALWAAAAVVSAAGVIILGKKSKDEE